MQMPQEPSPHSLSHLAPGLVFKQILNQRPTMKDPEAWRTSVKGSTSPNLFAAEMGLDSRPPGYRSRQFINTPLHISNRAQPLFKGLGTWLGDHRIHLQMSIIGK